MIIINQIQHYLPGILLSFSVALASKGITLFIPLLGAPAIALFLGILFGNTLFKQSFFHLGTRFSESRLLEYSIVLLGTLTTFQTLIHLGINGISFIVIQMIITIFAAIYIGKHLRFTQTTSLLMAAGNAVCGSSAIAATAPAIGATNEERGLVITVVNLMGTLLMFIMPVVSYLLFKNDSLQTSALIGGTLQSVGQVVASASIVANEEINTQALIFKIVRILFIVIIVFLFSKITTHSNSKVPTPKQRKSIIPWYVYGFFLMCCISSFNLIPISLGKVISILCSWLEITALAAIGLRLDFSILKSQGKTFATYALLLGTIQIIAGTTLVYLLI